MRKRFLLPFLAALALPTAANANDLEYMFQYCVNQKIEKESNENTYVDARELQRHCACVANNISQNLSVRSCPDYRYVDGYKIDRFFKP